MTMGGILAPHDAGLVLRGLRTLELRMQRSNERLDRPDTSNSTLR